MITPVKPQAIQYKPKGAATAIGSLPLKDAQKAAELMISSLQEMPPWPQLPKRSFKENMYAQYTEGFPAVVVDEQNEKLYFDTENIDALEAFYQKYLDDDPDYFKISAEYASGLHAFLKQIDESEKKPPILKGQVTGPISFGLSVRDQNDKAIIYNEQFADVVIKGLGAKAKWQESMFQKIAPASNTVIFFDEPYLVSLGSAFVALSEDAVLKYLDECFSAVEGLTGIHVCGGTDWGLIMQTKVDIIHFDAYEFFESITVYPEQLNEFLKRGGILGWGITPHTAKIEVVSAESLFKQLNEKIAKIVSQGVDEKKLLDQLLIAPSCGAGSLSPENAERALTLTKDVSKLFRKRYSA